MSVNPLGESIEGDFLFHQSFVSPKERNLTNAANQREANAEGAEVVDSVLVGSVLADSVVVGMVLVDQTSVDLVLVDAGVVVSVLLGAAVVVSGEVAAVTAGVASNAAS